MRLRIVLVVIGFDKKRRSLPVEEIGSEKRSHSAHQARSRKQIAYIGVNAAPGASGVQYRIGSCSRHTLKRLVALSAVGILFALFETLSESAKQRVR